MSAVLALSQLVVWPARADEAANTATARSLGEAGVLLADAGKCREAIDRLARAEELHHAPTTAGRLGECEIDLGKLVAGSERLRRVVREALPAGAPAAFVAAVARAQRQLDRALPRIGMLCVSLKAPPGLKPAITIDDEPAPPAILDTDRPIDPGTHRIQVTAPGFLPATVSATVDEGLTRRVVVELQVDPSGAAGSPPTETSAGGGPLATDQPSKVPAFLALGMATFGLGVGIVSAATVSHETSILSRSCDANRVCPESNQADISNAKRWATVSTVGFAVAGVGLVTGLVLLVARGGSSAPRAARGVRPSVGATSVSLDGVF